MNWRDYYAIAQSLRARSDWLFAQGEHQYASEGVWGALRYASRALKARYGGADGNRSLEKGYIPGRPNSPVAVDVRIARVAAGMRSGRRAGRCGRTDCALAVGKRIAQAFLQQQPVV